MEVLPEARSVVVWPGSGDETAHNAQDLRTGERNKTRLPRQHVIHDASTSGVAETPESVLRWLVPRLEAEVAATTLRKVTAAATARKKRRRSVVPVRKYRFGHLVAGGGGARTRLPELSPRR